MPYFTPFLRKDGGSGGDYEDDDDTSGDGDQAAMLTIIIESKIDVQSSSINLFVLHSLNHSLGLSRV